MQRVGRLRASVGGCEREAGWVGRVPRSNVAPSQGELISLTGILLLAEQLEDFQSALAVIA